MTESLTKVYDLFHPSPPTLKRIASISVVLQLWRQKINEYRETNSLYTLHLAGEISSSVRKLHLPSTILKEIDECTYTTGRSIDFWLEFNCKTLLHFHRDSYNKILQDFNDFVCDFDYDVHSSRTAKRMMLCGRFSIDEKFIIACMHCFEDDIERIWPLVSTRVNLDDIDFEKHAILYYWICRLTNQLEKIPGFDSGSDETVEDIVFLKSPGAGWNTTALDYFWNRLNPANRWKMATHLSEKNFWICSKYVVTKLNEEELDKFIFKGGHTLPIQLLTLINDVQYVLPVWMLMKHKMSESNFLLFANFLFEERDMQCAGRQVWQSAPNDLKQVIIRELLPDTAVYLSKGKSFIKFKISSFLFAILEDVSSETRNAFWHMNWSDLIVGCKTEKLSCLMQLCLVNETEILQFKESTLSKYENIRPQCSKLFLDGHYQELEKFVKFCCPSEQSGRDLMVELLSNDLELNWKHFDNAEIFDDFIKEAFNNDEEKIHKFKINISLSLDLNDSEKSYIMYENYRPMMNFVDRFVVLNERTAYLKKRYLAFFTEQQLKDRDPPDFEDDELSQFIRWCFDDNERDIAEFKQTFPMPDLIE